MQILVKFIAFKCRTEVAFSNKWILDYFLAGSRGNYFSMVDDVRFVGNFKGSFDIVIGDKDADSGRNEPSNFSLKFLNSYRVNSAEWFIQQYKRGISNHRTRDFKLSPLASRQKPRLTVDYLAKTEPLNKH